MPKKKSVAMKHSIGTHASVGNTTSAIAGKKLHVASRNAYSSKLFFNNFSNFKVYISDKMN